LDKYGLSERDICTKFITPAIQAAGWQQAQFREDVSLTDGRVMVRGKLAARVRNPDAKGGPKRAYHVLYARPNVPLAVVEAKQARFPVGQGMQQAPAYAEMLDANFAISSTYSRDPVHTYLLKQGIEAARRDVEGADRAPLEPALGQSKRCL